MLYLDETLTTYFRADAPLFDQLMALTGERFRDLRAAPRCASSLGASHISLNSIAAWVIVKYSKIIPAQVAGGVMLVMNGRQLKT